MKSASNHPTILILEDDPDQLLLLIDLVAKGIKVLIDDENTSNEQRQKLSAIRIIKVTDIDSLQRTCSLQKDLLLAILDCNTPDNKGGAAHDQFVKTNHVITGQHRAVDIVSEQAPGSAITMISSMDRFRTMINRYYANNFNLNINFASKRDLPKIKQNVEAYLKHYLKTLSAD